MAAALKDTPWLVYTEGDVLTLAVTITLLMVSLSAGMLLRARDNESPPRVRSWLPFIGSAIEMNADILKFLRKYKTRFPEDPMFTAHIAGVDMHFITDVDYIGLPYKPIKGLDDLQLQRMFMERVLDAPPEYSEEIQSGKNPGWVKQMYSNIHTHLLKSDALEQSIQKAQTQLDRLLLEHYPSKADKFPLFKFVKETVFCMSVVPLIGEELNNPELAHKLIDLESKTAFLFFGVPGVCFPKAIRARRDISGVIQSPSFLTNSISDLIRAQHKVIPSNLFDCNVFGLLWAAVANSMPAVCWMMYYLLKDPVAFKAVRDEIMEIKCVDGRYTLELLDSMVTLQSAFTETLRLCMTAWKPADVLEDIEVTLGAKHYTLKKGSRLMAYVSLLHMDPDVFESPEEFRFDRFLGGKRFTTHSGKVVPDPTQYVFGGGKHLCSGRKFISYEAKAIMAQLVRRYDMELLAGTTHPGVLNSVEGLGVSIPKNEVYVRFEKRPTI